MKIIAVAICATVLVATSHAEEGDKGPAGTGDRSSTPAAEAKASIATAHLRLEYDLTSGRADIRLPDGRVLLRAVTAAAGLPRGSMLAADAAYTRRSRTAECGEAGLVGPHLVIDCAGAGHTLDLQQRITLLKDRPAAVFEVVLTNVSKNDVPLCHSEPVRALIEEGAGSLFDAGNWFATTKVLTNGYMYYDPGQLLDAWAYGHRDFTSWWTAAFCRKDRRTMVVGYLDNREAEGQIMAGWDFVRNRPAGNAAMNLTARSLYNRAFALGPGRSISSGRVMLLLADTPFDALEGYADTCGRVNQVRLNPIINGWCSWFYTFRKSTEDEQLKNAEFITRHLKPYGVEWVQIDDGYQRCFGDWEGNARYPHGMKWLAGRIRALGLRAGIWLAPFVIAPQSDVGRNHTEWLLRDADGALFRTPGGDYCLDVTHPQARQWLFDLFHTMAEEWGYDFFKIDFVEWSVLAAERYHDPAVSRAAAYRLAIETIRKAIGPSRHLLDCGPLGVGTGLVDSMRIELDRGTDWSQYTEHFNSTAPAMANRYYHHRRMWINDADHLGIGKLPLAQGQAAASILALSGGTMILADRLYALDAQRLAILQRVLPAYGEAARPLDLFEKSSPELFALPVVKDFEKWWVLGAFNYDPTATRERSLDLAALGLDRKKQYLAYEFWSQRLYEPNELRLDLRWEPASVQLLAIREKSGVPQVLGTDRHCTQGGIELDGVHWDAATQTLSGTARGGRGTEWTLSVYVPQAYSWDASGSRVAGKGTTGLATSQTARVLRVPMNFPSGEQVAWHLRFSRDER